MLISVSRQLAVLAMPKTGTTAIEQGLAPLCEISFKDRPDIKHMNLRAFQKYMLPYLQTIGSADIETFCVVREPIDWLSSWYRYRSRPALDGSPRSTNGISFAEFIEGYLERPQKRFANVGYVSHFLRPCHNKPNITHLFRYDSMDRISSFLTARFKKEVKLAKVNVSPPMELSLPKSLKTRLEVERAKDFAIYADQAL
jgi:hypothetical protein